MVIARNISYLMMVINDDILLCHIKFGMMFCTKYLFEAFLPVTKYKWWIGKDLEG
jgi:myo-inositol catabolism protein IolC